MSGWREKGKGSGQVREKAKKIRKERERERESKLLLSSDIASIDLSNAVSLVTGGWFENPDLTDEKKISIKSHLKTYA